MKTPTKVSAEKPTRPKINKPIQRTLDVVLVEIRDIIDNTHWIETRLARLRASGYQIEECWVKNGSIEAMWYMKRKKVIRIQVTESELHGKYHKANCVIVPASDIVLKASDASKVRHFPIIRDVKPDTSMLSTKKATDNNWR
jgi:hypothetical protein